MTLKSSATKASVAFTGRNSTYKTPMMKIEKTHIVISAPNPNRQSGSNAARLCAVAEASPATIILPRTNIST